MMLSFSVFLQILCVVILPVVETEMLGVFMVLKVPEALITFFSLFFCIT